MATASIFLQPPHTEDTMDVSSPAPRATDEDIDIDLDDYSTALSNVQADEDMLDEDASNGEEAVDDLMLDDEHTDHQPPRTYTSTTLDDDLIDYSDEEDYQTPSVPPATAFTADKDALTRDKEASENESSIAAKAPALEEVQTGEHLLNVSPSAGDCGRDGAPPVSFDKPEDAEPLLDFDDEELDDLTESAHDAGEHVNEQHGKTELDSDAADTAHTQPGEQLPLASESENKSLSLANEHEELVGSNEDEQDEDTSHAIVRETDTSVDTSASATEETNTTLDNSASSIPELDTSVPASASAALDAPGTPTDTGLHPVVFYYNDEVYPLFRSKSSPDGLLKDDNLVSVSLADLIKACRQRLAIKTDHVIAENLEVLMTFENLHLTVIEDTPSSFQTSLKDVLDVFVQLHENDGIENHDIPALEVTCCLQVRFNSSIEILQKAASIGDGISNFVTAEAEYDDTDDIQHDALSHAADATDAHAEGAYDESYERPVSADQREGEDEGDHDHEQETLHGEHSTEQGYDYDEEEYDDDANATGRESYDAGQEAISDHQEATDHDGYIETAAQDPAAQDPAHKAPELEAQLIEQHEANLDYDGPGTAEATDVPVNEQTDDLTRDDTTTTPEVVESRLSDKGAAAVTNEDDFDLEFDDDILEEHATSRSLIPTKTTPSKRGREDSEDVESDSKRQRADP